MSNPASAEVPSETVENSPPKPEPPAKKKRGAENQITKDDYDDADDEETTNEEKLKEGFQRASEDVLQKRKIYKVKRPSSAPKDATTNGTTTTNAKSDDNTSKNPFAATALKAEKKVFGSASGFGINGASGFGSSSSSNGFGAFSSSSGFGTSSSNKEKTSSLGFGSSKSSSAFGSETKSLFGRSTAGITFTLSEPSALKKKEDTGNPANLPDSVDLKTGEEGEETIHSGRCKSYEWVAIASETKASKQASSPEKSDSNSNSAKNPSVQSSTQFQTTNESTTEKETSSHKWRELGIGPVKLLRSKSQPDRLRLVQRRESSKMGPATKVILNVPLWQESTCERDRQAQQYVRVTTLQGNKMCQYSLKFKESSEAGTFHHYLEENIPLARQCFQDNDDDGKTKG